MKYILTVDGGTTSVKGALFDLSGKMLGSHVHEYSLEEPAPDIVELPVEVYWQAVVTVIREMITTTAIAPRDISALGVTSQGETLIVLDQNGRPLRKAIVWLDNRAKEEAESIKSAFGRDQVYRVTGQPDIVPGWPAAKILWLRRHEPEVFKSAARFLMLEDYLIYRLTGQFATDHAMNPSTLYYDMVHGGWWPKMLDFLGLTAEQLPVLLPSGAVAGTITADIGLDKGTPVTVAPIDQVASAVGAGNIAPGMVTETTGCALAVCAAVDHPVYDPEMRVGLYRHAIPGTFVLLPWIPTAGMVLRWFRDAFGEGADYPSLVETASGIAPGSDGLILLPHLCGMNSPEIHPEAKGVFYGITPAHRKAHFVRAILESIAFALRDNLELLEKAGFDGQVITSLGGAARSRLWLQIKADVLQKPVNTMQCEETTGLGTAILAATGTGAFRSITEAVSAMVHPSSPVEPHVENQAVYDRAFQVYQDLNKRIFAN